MSVYEQFKWHGHEDSTCRSMHTHMGFSKQRLKNTAESSTLLTLSVHVPKSHKTPLHGLLIKIVRKLKNTKAQAIPGDSDLIGPGTST